jgi:ribosomal protein S4E
MKKIQQVMENNETMLADGFEDAIIGLDTSNEVFRVVYDKDKMIDILIESDDMSYEDAIEYLEYNVFNTYMGEGTPIYVHGGSHERILELMSQL